MKILGLYLFLSIFFSCKENKEEKVILGDDIDVQYIDNDIIKEDALNVVAVGDIMIGSAFPSEDNLPSDDGVGSFDEVKEYLKGDIVFGNLEGVLLDSGDSEKCKGKNPSRCYAFRMPERYGEIIKNAGFNVLSIANNHTGDFGEVGRKRTKEVLEKLQIYYAGQKEKPYEIFEIGGIKYGFCAFSPNRNMISINDIKGAKELVKNLKLKVGIVIVSFHGGAEGVAHSRVPRENEIFFGENRGDVYHFSHSVIDAGADLVLGHGPHIPRAVELYKGKFIAYSLGNFNTYGMFNLKGDNGLAPILDIKMNKNGDFLYANVISAKQTIADGLMLDSDNQSFNRIKLLSEQDFPESNLKFESNKILKRE